MEYGGIRRKGEPKVFLVSTTHGGETHGIAAAMATIDVYEKNNVIQHNHAIGDYFIRGVHEILTRRNLTEYFEITGFNWCVGLVVKNAQKEPDFFYRTLFMQEMIERGVLYQGILSPSFSHTTADIDFMLAAFDESCNVFERALESGYQNYLVGEEIKPVFRKFN
jgi:4-aminobutyrate aminotransferase-like enzyme